ncbi:DnaJ-like protein subfamily C member 16 [Trichoplax sp. H2]|nr:DnaJ-like protein subfamily C member 16 [Trichoplax sp. H2]|eukprot:RDD44077.1 DnaJ-like protein subfamily C member 16 [Trichoplax sp. H2]
MNHCRLLAIFVSFFFLFLIQCFIVIASPNPYQVLQVHRDASQSEIRRAFKKLALQWHPDKNEDPHAQNKFIEIKNAYEILSDKEKRAEFDRFGYVRDDGSARHERGQRNPFHQFAMNDDIFSFMFQDGFDNTEEDHIIDTVNMYQFKTEILPNSNFKPYVLEIFSNFCLKCLMIQSTWVNIAKELESIGLGTGQVNSDRDYALIQYLGVTGLPSVYVVVEEEIFKYTGELSKKMLRNFIHDLLPTHLIEKVTDETNSTFFEQINRPKLLLFSSRPNPSLKLSLLAMEFQNYVKFGMASLGSENNKLREQFNAHPSDPTAFLFKENQLIPFKILLASDMKAGALHKLVEDNKYLNLPRLESHTMFYDLCKEKSIICIILFIADSTVDKETMKRVEEIMTDDNVNIDNVRMAYASVKLQGAFFNSFDMKKLSKSTDECTSVYHDKVLFLKRLEDDEAIYDWYEDGWCVSSSSTRDLIMKARAYATSKNKMTSKTILSKLVDENAPGIFGRMQNSIKFATKTLKRLPNYIFRIEALPFFMIPMLCIFVASLTSLVGPDLPNHDIKRKKKREKAKLHSETASFRIPQLSYRNEDDLIHDARHGHLTMLILLPETNNEDARNSPLFKTFASVMNIHRREFLSLGCCWLSLTAHKNWCWKLLAEITPIDESLTGCVLAINGYRQYFMFLKLSGINSLKQNDNDANDCGEFLGLEDVDNVKVRAKQLRHKLPDWIGRLRDGSLTRYSVEIWPKISILDEL